MTVDNEKAIRAIVKSHVESYAASEPVRKSV